MKRLVCLISGCWFLVSAIAQTSSLAIATDKTTSLVFPFPVSHVDRGTKDVLVEKVPEAANILLVKAATLNFPETNLSVITEDGSIYSFRVNYEPNPSTLIWHVPIQKEVPIETYSNGILDNPTTIHGIRDHRWEMTAKVAGIYIRGNVIYYQLRLDNRSSIDYDVDLLRFYIRDQRKGRRTAVQEIELKPLLITGNTTQVKANNHNTIVVALEKFTIPDKKYLVIQIMEKNGGRHLRLKVKNNKIIQAIALPDFK